MDNRSPLRSLLTAPFPFYPLRRRGAACGLCAAVLALAVPTAARATTADDLCQPTDNPCQVATNIDVTPGSVIDVGTRQLVIAAQGTLNLTSGIMTLQAGEFTVDPGGNVRARGTASTTGGKIVVIAGRITINGSIDASGSPGGTASLTSTGPLTLAGLLDVRSRGTTTDGGTAELQGTDVTVTASGQINALASGQDFGGLITIRATGNLVVGGGLTATGGDGGDIDMSTSGSLSINNSVAVQVDATAAGGSGGGITASAVGNLIIDGDLSATGRNGSADTGGGDGGTIALDGATIAATRTMSTITASAGGPDGIGGDIDLTSSVGDIDSRGHIDVSGTGANGTAGVIAIDSAGAAAVSGTLDSSGGGGGGGDITISSAAVVTINMSASLTVAASGPGTGGDIDLSAADSVIVVGSLTSDGGPAAGGTGGSNTLSACNIRVDSAGRLSSLRTNGSNLLIGRDSTVIIGALRADPGSGQNTIRFAGPAYEPLILPAAQINPAASLVQDPTIVPCNPFNTPTPTVTRTPTRSASEAPTPTATPGACVGDCDGNGIVSVSDLIVGVNIALGNQPISACPAFDADGSGMVTVGELIQGVNNALNGCP